MGLLRIHQMAPWEQLPPSFGSKHNGHHAGLSNLEKDPLSGSVCFVTDHMYSRVRCGLVDKMISEFSELHGS